MSVNEWLVFGAFMKLQSVLLIFIVILILYCGEFPREIWIDLVNLVKKYIVERGLTKMGFLLFWWVQMFGLHSFDSILFHGPSFSHWLCYFNYFFKMQWHFVNLKRGSLVHLV